MFSKVVNFQLLNGVTPVTGQAANITFRVDPYATPGNLVGGLTITEVPALSGSYQASGFTGPLQYTKIYLSGTEYTSIKPFQTGDSDLTFMHLSGDETVAGAKAFTGNNTHAGIETFSSNLVASGNLQLTGAMQNNFDMNGYKITDLLAGTTNGDAVEFSQLAGAGQLTRKLIVNGDQSADVAGRLYRTIKDAIAYIHASGGTLSATNRWTIEVHGKGNGANYLEDFIWYSYIDIVGVGNVKIQNTNGTFSLWVRSGTSKVKMQNCIIIQTDINLNLDYIMFENCVFVSTDGGSDFGSFGMQSSQFKNCDFNFTVDPAYFVSNGNNKILGGCTSNGALSSYWQSTDKIFGLSTLDGVNVDY